MWQFLCGFGTGIWVATHYDCKPGIEKIKNFVKTNIPTEKHKDSSNSNKKN